MPSRTPRKPSSAKRASDPVEKFARDVVAGKIVAGPLVRAAAARHLDDLEKGPDRGLYWDWPGVREGIARFFNDVLKLPSSDEPKPFILEPWQLFCVGSLFGWRRGKGGPRRFRTGYIETGKGSGKSPLGAGIGLYMLVADNEPAAECYTAATMRDQAQIPFRDAVGMVRASPALSKRLQLSGDREVFNLAHRLSGSFFRPISSEGRGLDGKRVHYGLIDEVHEHPTPIVVEKITAGLKGRKQPLVLEITNSGVDRTSICYQHHEYSERIVTRQIEDDEWFAYVCNLDDGDDPFADESCWPKVNPTLGVTIQPEYLRKQVREALGMPAKQSIVKRLNFCMWVEAANPAIDQELWEAAQSDFDRAAVEGLEISGALDLSGTRDLTALGLRYEPDAEGFVHVEVEFFTPKDTLQERSRRDRVPYDLWVEQGHVTATPGRAVDYRFIAQRLAELQVERGLRRVCFDPYRIKYLEREVAEIGLELELVPHGQGYYRSQESQLWMPRSVELFEELLGSRKLKIKRNPALTYCAASAVHVADAKANRVYDKRKSTGRIDGIVALAMAIGASEGAEKRSVYEERGILTV